MKEILLRYEVDFFRKAAAPGSWRCCIPWPSSCSSAVGGCLPIADYERLKHSREVLDCLQECFTNDLPISLEEPFRFFEVVERVRYPIGQRRQPTALDEICDHTSQNHDDGVLLRHDLRHLIVINEQLQGCV